MNLGGEPDRDDSGLPPVDIEIPDDARELDRDVQAYYREQRALRRHLRRRRWGAPLRRDGTILPLLAGCLVLALISGTLLAVFSAGSDGLPGLPRRPAKTGNPTVSAPAAGPSAGSSASPATTPTVTAVTGPGHRLPDRTIKIGGKQLRLRLLTRSVLTLVPQGCGCRVAVGKLITQAVQAHVPVYLVGTAGGMPGVQHLVAQTEPRQVLVGEDVYLADDVHNVLFTAYPHSGLTAILVAADGSVALAPGLGPGLQLTSPLMQLASGAAPGS